MGISKCAQGALFLRREPSKGEPLEILELMDKAASIKVMEQVAS